MCYIKEIYIFASEMYYYNKTLMVRSRVKKMDNLFPFCIDGKFPIS